MGMSTHISPWPTGQDFKFLAGVTLGSKKVQDDLQMARSQEPSGQESVLDRAAARTCMRHECGQFTNSPKSVGR